MHLALLEVINKSLLTSPNKQKTTLNTLSFLFLDFMKLPLSASRYSY